MDKRYCLQELGWYWIHCRIPADWECVRYSIQPQQGELEFHNRHGLQAVLRWQTLKRIPDGLRILNAWHKDHLEKNNDEALLRFTQLASRAEGDWIMAWDLPGSPFHACHYHAQGKVFLHWIFSDFTEAAREGWARELLHSCNDNAEDIRKWRIIGIRADLRKTWKPVEIKAIPANVEIVFEGPKKAHIHVRRLGIPDVLLQEHDLFSLYGSMQKKLVRKVYDREDCTAFGCPAVKLTIEERGWFGFEKMVGKWWQGTALAWHDKQNKRIHAIEMVGPKKVKMPEVSDVWSPASS